MICAWPATEDTKTPDFPALAVDKVRHVGDCVAVVLATGRYEAADALEAIDVDYEPLPAVVDMEAALAEGSPLVHDDTRHQPLLHQALSHAATGTPPRRRPTSSSSGVGSTSG